MNNNMKKALVIAAATLSLSGCFKLEEDQVFTEILFDAAAYKSAETKSGPIEGAYYDYTCPEFTVYLSYVAPNETWAANHANSQYYAKAVCSADQTNEIWTSNPVTYWPLSGSLTFVGFSPKTVESSFEKGTLTCSSYDITGQDDIMFSAAKDAMDLTVDSYLSANAGNQNYKPDYTPDGTQNKNTTGVPIIFRHALSQVLVKVSANSALNEDIKFSVSSLTFNEKSKAEMTVVTYGDEPTVTWSLNEASSEIKHPIISSATEVNTGASFTSDSNTEKTGNQGFLIFPQDAQKANLEITYSQYQFTGLTASSPEYIAFSDAVKAQLSVDATGKVWSKGGDITRTIALNTDSFTQFQAGKKYVLDVTLTAAQILYSPYVYDWEDYDADSNTPGIQNPGYGI